MRFILLWFVFLTSLVFGQLKQNIFLTIPSPTDSAVGEVRLGELKANGSNYFYLKASNSMSGNAGLTMPTGFPSANDYCLKASTSGVGSWDLCTVHAFGATFVSSDGTSALTAGATFYQVVPFACTIRAWSITANAGTVTFDVWKIATGTANPTISNTIVASAFPALATGTTIRSTTLTGWTTSVALGDIVGINLKTVATAASVNLTVECI